MVRSLILIATQGFGDTFMLEKNIATQRLNFPVENFLSLPDIFIITLRNYSEPYPQSSLIPILCSQYFFQGELKIEKYFFALLSPHGHKKTYSDGYFIVDRIHFSCHILEH